MKRNLLTLCFISVLALATSYAQTMQIYHGAVGNLTATFTLTWHDNGRVTGSYYYHSLPKTVYRLSGNNYSQGTLELTEFTNNQKTATLQLSKSVKNNIITWRGTMYNTDGRQFSMYFSR